LSLAGSTEQRQSADNHAQTHDQETQYMHDKLNTGQDTEDEPARDNQSTESDPAGSSADVKAPFAPHEDDDSAFGDTDQHSTA
jgi:hypothetical protein